jgi:hypothetical protein
VLTGANVDAARFAAALGGAPRAGGRGAG